MNNFVLLAGAGDFFHTTPIFGKYQFINKCFHLRAGAGHHFFSWREVQRVCWTLPSRMKGGLGKWQEEGGRIICRHVRSVKSEFLGAILQRIWACPLVVCPQGNKGWYPVFTLCVSQIPPGSCFLVTVKWGCFGAVSKRASYFHGDFLMKHTRWYYFLLIWPFFSPLMFYS